MDFIKDGIKNLKGLGFGAALPGLRDKVFNAVENITSSDGDQKAKMQAVIDEDRAKQQKMVEEKSRPQARPQGRMMQQNEPKDDGGYKSYKKGGKVSSASKRADGCALRGKTKGRMV
jgi:hypothetical protein